MARGIDFRSQCLARGVPREVALARLRLIVVSLDGSGAEPDPYEVLQVSSEAGAEEIKRAFRQASFIWPPDRNPERPEVAAASAAGSGNGVKPGSAGAMGKGPPGEAAGSGRAGPAGGREGAPDGQPAAPATASPAPPAKPAPREQTAAADDPAVIEQRIRNFLDRYTRTFARRDLAAFRALFEADAVENGRSFWDLQSQYERNFRELAGVDYRIRMRGWLASRSSCTVTTTFALTAHYRDDRAVASQGSIELVLTPRDDGFRVSRLQYTFQR